MKRLLLATVASFVTTVLCATVTSAAPPSARSTTATMRLGTTRAGNATADIDPFSKINARVFVVDNGTSLTINGSGSGFDASLSYTSFFYGIGSLVRGSLACIPPTPNNLTVPQMITAYWLPVGSTRRTLTVVNSGLSYTPLSTIGTMSVRYDSTPTLPLNQNLNPGRFWLNSCGRVQAY